MTRANRGPSRPGQVEHPLFARFFARTAARNEQRGQAELRRELLAGLSGVVVEAGAGSGLNFCHYPPSVRAVIAVEPEPYLREKAAQAARSAPVPVHVTGGTASQLPVDDSHAAAVVVSGVLCSVPDVPAALTEFRRVLRPGGELRFYEHVRVFHPLRGRYQDTADLVWPRLMGGCHPNRDTEAAITSAGYRVCACRALVFPPGALFSPVAPRIIGRAVVADTTG
jgi:ubiquinone/menaquinone biosynthesis C-methylase UbiE